MKPGSGRLDHIDLRVPNLAQVAPFYHQLLPALGFTRQVDVKDWLQYEAPASAGGTFFGITQSPSHVPNEIRIAFRATDEEEVDSLAEIAKKAGALHLEGPLPYEPGYYAVFFEDPAGNRLEICSRTQASD